MKKNNPVKYIFVVGGVISGLGKGIAASSIGYLLKSAGYNVCLIRVDFPDPETPVTQTNFPIGIEQLIFFKLLPVAPSNIIFLLFPTRLFLL